MNINPDAIMAYVENQESGKRCWGFLCGVAICIFLIIIILQL